MKLLIGILTGYKKRADAVRQTWLRGLPDYAEAYFLGCGPERIEGDTLYLDCEPYYENLPERVISFMRYACLNFEFDWLFKCDDDTYVDWDEFERTRFDGDYFARPCGSDVPAGEYFVVDQHCNKVRDRRYQRPILVESNGKLWGHGGWGYFLSRKAAQIVADYQGPPLGAIYEDITVGMILAEAGVELVVADHFGTHHPVGPEAMLAFHEGRVIEYQNDEGRFWQPVPMEVYERMTPQHRAELGLPAGA